VRFSRRQPAQRRRRRQCRRRHRHRQTATAAPKIPPVRHFNRALNTGLDAVGITFTSGCAPGPKPC